MTKYFTNLMLLLNDHFFQGKAGARYHAGSGELIFAHHQTEQVGFRVRLFMYQYDLIGFTIIYIMLYFVFFHSIV